jgi:hypothetical protein
MKNKKFTIATVATLTALAATLLFQPSISQAEDRGDDHERGGNRQQINRFAILLSGVYKPVPLGQGPKGNLGLTKVNLSDNSFSKVNFYPLTGIRGDEDKAIGTFYVQVTGTMCAYDLPGGSISAMFTMIRDVTTDFQTSDDGSWTLDGTFELDIMEATGAYSSFVGGHIHMVDILKFRAGDSTLLEDCFCHIHPKLAKP